MPFTVYIAGSALGSLWYSETEQGKLHYYFYNNILHKIKLEHGDA